MIAHRRSWSLRVVLIGLLVAAILLATLPAIAQGGVAVRTANNLRLRSEPSTNGAVLTSVPMGTALTATATNSGGRLFVREPAHPGHGISAEELHALMSQTWLEEIARWAAKVLLIRHEAE